VKIEYNSIGYVENDIIEQTNTDWGKVISKIILEPEYAIGLKGFLNFRI
jgi:tRNA (Thr-GGU) A37 N-methylase